MVRMRRWGFALGVLLQAAALAVVATEVTEPGRVAPPDDSHDFDFSVGVWHTHTRHVLDRDGVHKKRSLPEPGLAG